MARVIEMIDEARADGLDVTADMYPYIANGTGLTSVLPPWAEADGKLFENLTDPEMRAKIKAEALSPSGDWEAMAEWAGPEGVMPVGFERDENRQYAGMRLTEISEARDDADWIDTAFELLLSERQRISTIYFSMSEDNLAEQLRQPWIKVSTDAGGNGITAVPTYVINGRWAIPGAQEPETFAQVLRKMADQAVAEQT